MYVAIIFISLVYAAMIYGDQKFGLLRTDMLDTPLKLVAYLWLGVFLFFIALEAGGSSMRSPTAEQLAHVPFYRLFLMHFVLVLFLFIWWLIVQRPRFTDFLNIQRKNVGEAVMTGFAVGTGGWLITVIFAILIGAILSAAGLVPRNMPVPPMITYMANMAMWKKALLVISAATIEEAFFRGWLQKRIGLVFSTMLFALAHVGYGQPLFLIGVTIVSIVIGTTFYRTKNLIPGMIAHGIFDAVQLFVMIPLVVKLAPQ